MSHKITQYDCGIYRISALSGNFYIGSSKQIPRRWAEHRNELRSQRHRNVALQNAFNKYGEQGLVFEKLLVCAPEDLLLYEQQYLDFYKPEYNIVQIAGSGPNRKGIPHSLEHRQKLSKALIGNTRWVGKKHKPETIEKMRQRALGKKPSERKMEINLF